MYRKVKSILNKVTPQTLDMLGEDLLGLEPEMDTNERTLGVIDILFQKVCDEPGFCEMYGKLCDMITQKQTKQANKEKTESFRYQLLTKCQQNFELDKNTERLKEEKLLEIEKAETVRFMFQKLNFLVLKFFLQEDLKKQLTADLDETLTKHKWRTLGSIRYNEKSFF